MRPLDSRLCGPVTTRVSVERFGDKLRAPKVTATFIAMFGSATSTPAGTSGPALLFDDRPSILVHKGTRRAAR
jgi:hypothetical protein